MPRCTRSPARGQRGPRGPARAPVRSRARLQLVDRHAHVAHSGRCRAPGPAPVRLWPRAVARSGLDVLATSSRRILEQVEVAAEVGEYELLEREQLLRRRTEQPPEQDPCTPGPPVTGSAELGGALAEDQDATVHAGRARLLSPTLYQSSPSDISEARSSSPRASLMRCVRTPDSSRVTSTTSSAPNWLSSSGL